MSNKYLYGADIFGIQAFIFETGKLKEIIGASEFVAQFCDTIFEEEVSSVTEYKPENLMLGAAGRIRYIFDDKASCQRFASSFAKKMKEQIPELSLSEAVVEFSDELAKDVMDELAGRLDEQRQKRDTPHGLGLMISERARRTGRPGVEKDKYADNEKALLDRSQQTKLYYLEKSKNSLTKKLLPDLSKKFAADIDEIVRDQNREWIAIVHADGNNLGRTIKALFKEIGQASANKMQEVFKRFSSLLDQSTQAAAQTALSQLIISRKKLAEAEVLPLRPVLLGGDDLSLIIRGDLALDFTHTFLKNFETETRKNFQELVNGYGLTSLASGLSACAGIAYIKPHYPFHYGVNLAEKLTKYAKTVAKKSDSKPVPSCLAFHKVQSSFVEDYKEIVKRELTAESKDRSIGFDYGPYFIDPQASYATIDDLKKWSRAVQRDDAPAAGLRNWLSELHVDFASAEQLRERIKNLNKRYVSKLKLEPGIIPRDEGENQREVTHLYDVLTIAGIEKNK